ncbi:hypothetical protein R3I93_017480 [Phoxinus phoxinus]|uniref:Uncharacterized protein n=1 Tax=Phoxinus phoxinus TaxID=58324 RepID=A0AAN9CNW6_9TELE
METHNVVSKTVRNGKPVNTKAMETPAQQSVKRQKNSPGKKSFYQPMKPTASHFLQEKWDKKDYERHKEKV